MEGAHLGEFCKYKITGLHMCFFVDDALGGHVYTNVYVCLSNTFLLKP